MRPILLLALLLVVLPLEAQEATPSKDETRENVGQAGHQFVCFERAGEGLQFVLEQRDGKAVKREALRALPAVTPGNRQKVELMKFMTHVGFDHPEFTPPSVFHMGLVACQKRAFDRQPKLSAEAVRQLLACQALFEADPKTSCYSDLGAKPLPVERAPVR